VEFFLWLRAGGDPLPEDEIARVVLGEDGGDG
jgi:hypothetical protein